MKERIGYAPTEAEGEAIDRAGVVAAFAVLQEIETSEESLPHWTLACVRAHSAARKAVLAAEKKLGEQHPECDFVSYYSSQEGLVSSAMFGLMIGLDEPSSIAPNALGGLKLLAFAKASVAMSHMSDAFAAFDDDEIFGAYMSDETEAIGKAVVSPA